MLMLRRNLKKLKAKYSEKCSIIENRLDELAVLEKDRCNSMDRAAEPFARLMEAITDYPGVCKTEDMRKILRWIGYNLGKWIYIIDAYDDVAKDLKEKNYNPLIYQFEYAGEPVDEFSLRIRDRVEFNLTYCLSSISKAFELLPKPKSVGTPGIIENIIYMGMLRKTEQVLKIRSCEKVEKSV